MKISKFIAITGIIHCESGLRIGGTKEGIVEPGGSENTIIRHPITSLPYIPGSSIKGKMRSLLELDAASGANIDSGKPCGCGTCLVCKVFGSHAMINKEITRILVRDCAITEASESLLRTTQEEKGLNFAEIKSENIIDRKTGIAANKGLRTQERVPAGTEFKMNITLKLFEGDDKDKMVDFVKKGLTLLQKDYLGSSGSRGYGKIKINNLEVKELS
ncbi:MAG: type III-A CRISPR-associated RAMP protein Csm3 [Nitrospinae bacterium RIFCSPLOWO2_12_39_15]|nr:MAG: type III-A CRISPR-associated RAMP protein Csm3 [Nitrospinae bacterium RIFCSPLOWO2_12_39_15]